MSYLAKNDDQRSTTTASDEDGSMTPRSVRFLDRHKDSIEKAKSEPEPTPSDNEIPTQKEHITTTSHR